VQKFDELFEDPQYVIMPPAAQQKKEKKFSKWVVVLSLILVLCFYGVVFWFIWLGYHIPDSVIYSFTGLFGVELSALAWRTGIEAREKQRTERVKYYERG